MGLFSSKKEYTASVSIAHMVDEYPDPIREAVLLATMSNTSISDSILIAQGNTFHKHTKDYLKYGEDHWVHGLPAASMYRWTPTGDAVLSSVVTHSGDSDATVTSYVYGYEDYEFVGDKYLQETYGGTPEDYETIPLSSVTVNEVTTTTRTSRYFIDGDAEPTEVLINFIDWEEETVSYSETTVEVSAYLGTTSGTVVTSSDSTDTVTTPNSSTGDEDTVTTEITTTVTTVTDHLADTSTATTEVSTVVVSRSGTSYVESTPYRPDTLKLQVIYTSLDVTYYWLYDPATGVYPSLNTVAVNLGEVGTYIQSLPLRVSSVGITNLPENDPYRVSVNKMGDLVKLNADILYEDFASQNDLEFLEDVFITYSLNVNTERQTSIAYMYEYFTYMHSIRDPMLDARIDQFIAENPVADENDDFNPLKSMEIVVLFGYGRSPNVVTIVDGEYRNTLRWVDTSINTRTGTIADKGKFTKDILSNVFDTHGVTFSGEALVIRKQVSDTQYTELMVYEYT